MPSGPVADVFYPAVCVWRAVELANRPLPFDRVVGSVDVPAPVLIPALVEVDPGFIVQHADVPVHLRDARLDLEAVFHEDPSSVHIRVEGDRELRIGPRSRAVAGTVRLAVGCVQMGVARRGSDVQV